MVATYETSVVEQMPTVSIVDRLTDLEERLGRGMAMIDERVSAGLPVDRYEARWLSLLSEYERVYDTYRLAR